jgi:hypothetical protein
MGYSRVLAVKLMYAITELHPLVKKHSMTAVVALFSFGLKRYWQKITIKRLIFLSIGERPLSGNG